MKTSSKPNFLVVVDVPRFDDRDAIVGYRSHVIAVAETYRFARYLAAREYEAGGLSMTEIGISVRNNDAYRSLAISPVRHAPDADIPF